MAKLNEKIALITGGSEGMGFDTAKEFIREGATVYVTGRRQDTLDRAVRDLGEKAIGIQADSAKLADLDRVYAQIKQDHSHLDIVFANAGVYKMTPQDQVTEEFFDYHFNVNVKGLYFTVQKAIPLMNAEGSVILNGSFIGSSGFPGMSVYGATKAAVRSLARTFTAELSGSGPRINVISPGPIHTAGNADSLAGNPDMAARITEMVPRKRIGEGLDIAKAAVFLASSDSSYIAGTELFVDGGINAV